jgi:serine protease Do
MNALRTSLLSLALCVALVGGPTLAQPVSREAALPSLAPLVDSVRGAVVNVEVVARGGMEQDEEVPEGFEQFFGHPFNPRQQIRKGAGSGFVIDPKGYLLTNNHVVEGASVIRVTFPDGKKMEGSVMGRDPLTDVAVVKLKLPPGTETLPSVKLGDSDAVKVGDWALAIGNPFGLANSVSLGIISARARQIGVSLYDDLLQTDAAINPGNSGGPLLNLKGEVIGINTAIVNGGTGIGFAVPSNLVKVLVPELEKGAVAHGYMGVATQPLTPSLVRALGLPVQEGAMVYQVEKSSPAEKAGFQRDDVIVAVDGQKVDSDSTLRRLVGFKAPGSTVAISLYRHGHPQKLSVTLMNRPASEGGRHHRAPERNVDEEQSHQAIGMRITDMNPAVAQRAGLPPEGALITEVVPGSAAEDADLEPRMVVVEANHRPIHGADELMQVIRSAKPGTDIVMRVEFPQSRGAQVRVLQKPS